jgi:4-carboxymuconolactone decarboxylase
MLSALNRPHEFRLHVKAALTNGLTKEEIAEAILQAAVYCGIPAGLDSMRLAREAFDGLEKEGTR